MPKGTLDVILGNLEERYEKMNPTGVRVCFNYLEKEIENASDWQHGAACAHALLVLRNVAKRRGIKLERDRRAAELSSEEYIRKSVRVFESEFDEKIFFDGSSY